MPILLPAYRSAIHEVTGWTPSEMMFGRPLRLLHDLLFGRLERFDCLPRLTSAAVICGSILVPPVGLG
ncbi:hypothetical protein AVEN_261200-1, partial [Araneus ventricosus]